jgi:hypothetical protein
MQGVNQEVSQQTLDAVREILKAGPTGFYIPGVGVQKDITTSTGLVAYNLEPAAKLLVPQTTPLRNRIARVKNTRGGTAAHWKQITALDNTRTDVFTAEGTKASTISYTVTDRSAAYATISKGDNITFQAVWAAQSFEDALAKMPVRLMKDVMIDEERAIIGGRIAALGTVSAPTCTTANDGSIAAGTYYVVARALTPIGRGKNSSATTVVVASTNDWSISMSTTYVPGATSYGWYIGTVSGSEKLQTTTYINSAKVTSYNSSGTAKPSDNSSDSLAFDGLVAQLSADNAGTASGAYTKTMATGTAGTGTQLALSDIDAAFKSLWDTSRADPDVIEVNSQQSVDITRLCIAAGLYRFVSNEAGPQAQLTGGKRVTHYINIVTGKAVPIETNPYMPEGTMLILSFEVPFSAADITNAIEIETRQEYLQIDYPLTKPAYEKEVLVDEVLKLYYVIGCGIIRNIAASS